MLPKVGDTSVLRNGGIYIYIYIHQNNTVTSKMVIFSTHRNEKPRFQIFDTSCQRVLLIDRIARGKVKVIPLQARCGPEGG